MAKFLFTMLPANDLGLPTRLVPIARVLADRGHEVAVFNPAPAPSKLIAEAGLENLPMPSRPIPPPVMDFVQVGSAWDVEDFFAALFLDEDATGGETAVYIDLIRDYDPDVVVDSFGCSLALPRVYSTRPSPPCCKAIFTRPAVAFSGGRKTARQVCPMRRR